MRKISLKKTKASNPFHVIFHPFDTFYDVRVKNEGGVVFTVIILLVWFLAGIYKRQSTGYIFNYNKLSELNIFLQTAIVVIPFTVWACANWVMSIFMNGIGRFRDIWIVSAYSAVPYVLGIFLSVLLSNVLSKTEPFADYVMLFGTAWSLILLFIGTMVIHEYKFTQNILSTILTVGVMFAILFLAMLFGSLWSELVSFVKTVTREILFRL
ncbi:MAG: hypothetical protein K0R92_985 [Lachnospiraceae bacterium]|nr:hypothetical protein [Lachnospiraceae bacterium]